MSKYGTIWSTPGRFASMMQIMDEVIVLASGREFTVKELQVACRYKVRSGSSEILVDHAAVGTYGPDDE
jgi:uncharacterized protein